MAIDCEMVGVGPEGRESVLARVSIVNFHGSVVMDAMVQPKERVVDFRTWVSGITPAMLENAESFETVQAQVAEILDGRILVGHAVHHDLQALLLSHPRHMTRDTSRLRSFRAYSKGKTPSLKLLTSVLLGRDIQSGSHSSVSPPVSLPINSSNYYCRWKTPALAWNFSRYAKTNLNSRHEENTLRKMPLSGHMSGYHVMPRLSLHG